MAEFESDDLKKYLMAMKSVEDYDAFDEYDPSGLQEAMRDAQWENYFENAKHVVLEQISNDPEIKIPLDVMESLDAHNGFRDIPELKDRFVAFDEYTARSERSPRIEYASGESPLDLSDSLAHHTPTENISKHDLINIMSGAMTDMKIGSDSPKHDVINMDIVRGNVVYASQRYHDAGGRFDVADLDMMNDYDKMLEAAADKLGDESLIQSERFSETMPEVFAAYDRYTERQLNKKLESIHASLEGVYTTNSEDWEKYDSIADEVGSAVETASRYVERPTQPKISLFSMKVMDNIDRHPASRRSAFRDAFPHKFAAFDQYMSTQPESEIAKSVPRLFTGNEKASSPEVERER